MIFRRFVTVLLAFLAPTLLLAATPAKPTRPTSAADGAYKGAIVVDAATGNVLFEDRADIVSPPASMTKLMTFAVLHDKIAAGALALDTPVTVMAADSKIGGTQVWLKEKEVFPVEELIYAMIIQSANDASFALARTAAGSVPAFVELMNAKARELGMTQTTFRTPHGLPPSNRKIAEGDLTSPRDFVLLSRYLIQKTNILKYSAVETRDFGPPVRNAAVKMDTHNNLLGHVAGVDGLKTGFTAGAGYCLAATAQRTGRRIIVVTMGSPASTTRDLKVTEMIERAFTALPPVPTIAITDDTSPITAAPLAKPAPAKAPAPDAPPAIKLNIPRAKK
ncbi:MAG TPA: D-alanyl-D-alanine carboxypeptidase family protein [Opitutaceae bacterium]|nr:D-alanyl-D-alanine carboxypeptidase family protein [Opitutaceae bacterium]